jgi:dihydrofolate reductase
MKISLIVAMATNRIIGINKQMPWHLSADLKKFKKTTIGSPILMGRKTHESIGKALPGRKNLVISRNSSYQAEGCYVFNDIQQAIRHCKNTQELFVIGGASFYKSMLPHADFIYLTEIHQAFTGDTSFPEINPNQWQEIEREDINNDTQVNFSYSFVKLQRVVNDSK